MDPAYAFVKAAELDQAESHRPDSVVDLQESDWATASGVARRAIY